MPTFPKYEDIPEGIREDLRHTVTLVLPAGGLQIQMRVGEYRVEQGALHLRTVAMPVPRDRQRAQGQPVNDWIWELIDELIVGGGYCWMVRPLAIEDR